MIQVVPVETKKQQREFVKFPLKLYPKKSLYVPALYGDEMKIFTDKSTYSDVAHHKCFLAYKDGKIVGRIQAIIQHQYNEMHNEKCARFCRIHLISHQHRECHNLHPIRGKYLNKHPNVQDIYIH